MMGFDGDIYDNTIVNGVHAGIIARGAAASNIYSNTIQLKSRYTNGFAIIAGSGSQIHNNTINCGTGEYACRGIGAGGAMDKPTTRVYENTIYVQGKINNQEYEGAILGGAYGIQLENAKNVEVYSNDVTAYGNEVDAYAFRMNSDGGTSGSVYVHGNIFRAVSNGARAAATKFTSIAAGSLAFEDNDLITNDGIVGVTANSTATLTRSHITINSPVANSHPFDSWYSGTTGLHTLITLLDSTFEDVSSRAYIENAIVRTADHYGARIDTQMAFNLQWTTTVQVKDSNGGVLPNAAVTITGNQVFSGASDALGVVNVLLNEFKTQGDVKTAYSPYTVTVTSGTVTKTLNVTADQIQTLNVVLDLNPDPNTILINQSWLDARGAGPYYLDQAGKTYVLQQDVTTKGTAFAIIASDVTFDLNGHTVTYDNAPPVVIPNGSFEAGQTGWNFTNAPNAEVYDATGRWIYNEVYDGNYSLKFNDTTKDEYIESAQTVTLDANTTYTLSGMFEYGGQGRATNNGGTDANGVPIYPQVKGYVQLLDGTGTVVAESAFAFTNNRGIQLVEDEFKTGANVSGYKIRVGIEGDPLGADPFYVDDIKIQRTKSYGVTTQVYSWSTGRYPGFDQFGVGTGAVIKNGTVAQGQSNGSWSHAVYLHQIDGVTIDHLNITIQGANTSAIMGDTVNDSHVTITNNTITSNVKTISSRDNADGGVINHVRGEIGYNTILNAPHFGITSVGDDTQIHHNTISGTARYTNAFAISMNSSIGASGAGGASIHDNVIANDSGDKYGPGIMLSGDKPTAVYNNIIRVRQHDQNQEYEGPQQSGVYGIQIERGSNKEIYNNTVMVYASVNEAHAFRIGGSDTIFSTNNYIHDNIFEAVRLSGSRTANVMKLNDVNATTNNRFSNNTLRSNDTFISTGYHIDTVMENSTFEVTGNFDTFNVIESINAGPTIIEFRDPVFVDAETRNEFETALVAKTYGTADPLSSFTVSWSANFMVKDSNAQALSNATVTIADKDGNQVFTGTTDTNGKIGAVLKQYKVEGNVKTEYSPYLVTVTSGTVTKTLNVTADQIQTVEINLSGTPIPDTTPPVIVVTSQVPQLTNQSQLTIDYTSDGVAKSKSFTLTEGANHLVITETDQANNTSEVSFDVTRDTVAPVLVVTGTVPTVTNNQSLTINYTSDGVAKSKDFTLTEGANTLQITEADQAGNQATLSFSVEYQVLPANVIVVDSTWIASNLREGALVFDQAGKTYQFTTDFRGAGTAIFVMASDVTIDLNGHTIFFGSNNQLGTMGINLFEAYHPDISLGKDAANYTFATPNWNNANNLTVKNGTVQWEGTTGAWATAIGTTFGGPITVDNMHLVTGGQDGWTINSGSDQVTVSNTYAESFTSSTENRHQAPGNIGTGGTLIAYNNIVVGGNSALVAGSNSIIYNNILRQSGYATNGYGVFLYRNDNVQVYNNIIVPTNGRGIIFNAGTNHVAYDNLIVVHEAPNAEFGDSLNSPGFRLRYDTNNIQVYHNDVLAIGGGSNAAGSGLYLSDDADSINYIHDNEFRAILTTPPNGTDYANAITMEAQLGQDVIENNIFASNNYLIRTNGYDGGVDTSAPLTHNTLQWVDGDETLVWLAGKLNDPKYGFQYSANNLFVNSALAASIKSDALTQTQSLITGVSDNMQRETFFGGYCCGFPGDATLIDTILDPDVTMNESDFKIYGGSGSIPPNVKIGHSLVVVAKDTNGTVLANRQIMLRDSTGITYTGTTDANGVAKLELIDYALTGPVTTNGVTKVGRTGHEALIAGFNALAVSLATPSDPTNPFVLTFTSGGFTDNVAPVVSGFVPADGATDILATKTVSVDIVDRYPGVDPASIEMFVGGIEVVTQKTATTGGFHVSYTPTEPFAYDQMVQVQVTAQDLDNNLISAAFNFRVEKAPAYPTTLWDANVVIGDGQWINSSVTNSVRLLVSGAVLNTAAGRVALEFQGRSSGDYQIKSVSIAEVDPACFGCVVDSTWTKVMFDGKPETSWDDHVMISANSTKVSDVVNFAIDPDKSYYISFKIVTPSVYLDINAPGGFQELYYYNTDNSSQMDWTDAGAACDSLAFATLFAGTAPPPDITPPVIVVTSSVPTLTNQSTLIIDYTSDGVQKSKTFNLVEGANHLIITETDQANNTSEVSFDITLDTVAPVITITSTVLQVTNNSSLTVQYTVDGGAEQSKDFILMEGANNLFITAIDQAGNTGTVSFSITLDTIAPVIVITSQVPTVTKTSVLAVTYTVDGGAAQTRSFTLVEGKNDLFIEATDLAGNKGQVDFTVILDTTAPVIVITSQLPQLTNRSNLTVIYTVDGISQSKDFTLIEGKNDLFIEATDLAGNASRLDLSITLDTVSPVIDITSQSPSLTNQKDLTVTYTVDGGSQQTKSFTLVEGRNDLFIEATDLAGNIGRVNFTVILDMQAPVIVVTSNVPTLTNQSALMVHYTSDGVAKTKSFTLTEGVNALQITETDQAGNTTTKNFSITLDTLPPSINVLTPIPALTRNSSFTVTYTVDGGADQTKTFALVEGVNHLFIEATDLAGNTNRVDFSIAYDSKAPVIVITSQVPAITNQPNLTVTYTVDGGAEQTKTFTLTEGKNDLFIEFTDLAGNTGSFNFSITLDTVAPQIIITSNVPNLTNQSTLRVNYTSDGVVKTKSFTLQEGLNNLQITERDQAGNIGTVNFSATLDTVTPAIVITSQVPAVTKNSALTVTYTVDGGAPQTKNFVLIEGKNDLFINAVDLAGNTGRVDFSVTLDTIAPVIVATSDIPSLTNSLNLTVVYTVDGGAPQTKSFTLVEGVNNLSITATDQAGNTGTKNFSITLDTIAPVIVITSELAQVTKNAALTVNYTSDGAAKTKSFTLVEGVNNLQITETDLAGNTGTINFSITLDTIPPVIVITRIPEKTRKSDLTVTYTVDGGTKQTKSFTLVEGLNHLFIEATDLAGNTTRVEFSIFYEKKGPKVTITSSVSAVTNQSDLTVTYTVDDGEPRTKSFTLTEGENHLFIEATDEEGNIGRTDFSVTLDTVLDTAAPRTKDFSYLNRNLLYPIIEKFLAPFAAEEGEVEFSNLFDFYQYRKFKDYRYNLIGFFLDWYQMMRKKEEKTNKKTNSAFDKKPRLKSAKIIVQDSHMDMKKPYELLFQEPVQAAPLQAPKTSSQQEAAAVPGSQS
jgi:hypothetical protein